MGTRSKTNVLDKNGKVIISIYRQMDGEFHHMGKDLKSFLKKNKLARQIDRAAICPEYNGGMEDLAGQLFCFLKTKSKYVMPAHPETNDDYAFEYEIGFTPNGGHGSLYLLGREHSYSWTSFI